MRKVTCFVCSRRRPFKAVSRPYGHYRCDNRETCKAENERICRKLRNRIKAVAGFVHGAVLSDWQVFGRLLPYPNNMRR